MSEGSAAPEQANQSISDFVNPKEISLSLRQLRFEQFRHIVETASSERFAKLTLLQQTVVKARKEGKSLSEIGEELGTSRQNIGGIIKDAERILRGRLNPMQRTLKQRYGTEEYEAKFRAEAASSSNEDLARRLNKSPTTIERYKSALGINNADRSIKNLKNYKPPIE